MPATWNHNSQYHPLVLASLPSPCARALDVGCGTGELSRKLATRCTHVTALDRDQPILAAAKATPSAPADITYLRADFLTYPFAPASFDFITAVATLHHLPLAEALTRMRDLLAPGGTLVIIGLYRQRTITDHLLAATAFPISRVRQLLRGREPQAAPMQSPRETFAEIRTAAAERMPGVRCRRRLFFRYSLIWTRPAT